MEDRCQKAEDGCKMTEHTEIEREAGIRKAGDHRQNAAGREQTSAV
jgi:hypothetical protein